MQTVLNLKNRCQIRSLAFSEMANLHGRTSDPTGSPKSQLISLWGLLVWDFL